MTASFVFLGTAIMVGLIFLAGKAWEIRRGVRVYDSVRTMLDQYASEIYTALVTGGIPLRWRQSVTLFMHQSTHALVQAAVHGLRAVERPLARLSYRMRVSKPKAGGAEVSEFLKTITPDKQGNGNFQEKSV